MKSFNANKLICLIIHLQKWLTKFEHNNNNKKQRETNELNIKKNQNLIFIFIACNRFKIICIHENLCYSHPFNERKQCVQLKIFQHIYIWNDREKVALSYCVFWFFILWKIFQIFQQKHSMFSFFFEKIQLNSSFYMKKTNKTSMFLT